MRFLQSGWLLGIKNWSQSKRVSLEFWGQATISDEQSSAYFNLLSHCYRLIWEWGVPFHLLGNICGLNPSGLQWIYDNHTLPNEWAESSQVEHYRWKLKKTTNGQN